jgi:hypothetical protein
VYFGCAWVFRCTLIGFLGADMRCIGNTLGDVLHHFLVSFKCAMVYFGGVGILKCAEVFLSVLLV